MIVHRLRLRCGGWRSLLLLVVLMMRSRLRRGLERRLSGVRLGRRGLGRHQMLRRGRSRRRGRRCTYTRWRCWHLRRHCHRSRRLHRHLLHLGCCSCDCLLLCHRLSLRRRLVLFLLARCHGHCLRPLRLHHRMCLCHRPLRCRLVRLRPLMRCHRRRLMLCHCRRLVRPLRHCNLQLSLLLPPMPHKRLAVRPELTHSLDEPAVER